MSEQHELIEEAKRAFSELAKSWRFEEPRIFNEQWLSRLLFPHPEGFGFELELDWREFSAFGLIVRLENGELPDGYYVSNGRRCRKHLQNVIREQGWPSGAINTQIRTISKPTRKTLEIEIKEIARLFALNAERIVAAGRSLLE